MDIYEVIRKQHEKHRTLLALLVKTHGDSTGRQELFAKVQDELTRHAMAEELTLYAALIAKVPTVELARHSIAEHQEVDDFLSELDDVDFSSSGWVVTAEKLKHRAEHHMEEEENDVFSMARQHISDEEATRLGSVFADYFNTIYT